MRVGPAEAEGGQGSSATPDERHVLALEDLAGTKILMGFHGISWDFHGIFMGF
jgi:hypothetical protein